MSSPPAAHVNQDRKAQSAVSTPPEADEIVSLLLAANPDMKINYKAMAAYSKGTRSASSLEHRFRQWRRNAEALRTSVPEVESEIKAMTGKAPAKRKRAIAKAVGSDSNGKEQGEELKVTKRIKKGNADAEKGPVIKGGIEKATKKVPGRTKEGSAKAPVRKKGTARVVDKNRLKGDVGIDEEDDPPRTIEEEMDPETFPEAILEELEEAGPTLQR